MNFLFLWKMNFSLSSAKNLSQFRGMVAKLGSVRFYLKNTAKNRFIVSIEQFRGGKTAQNFIP